MTLQRTKTAATVVINQDPVLKWKKIGGGSMRLILNGTRMIIKPGQVFSATAKQIPAAFLDLLQCLSEGGIPPEPVQKTLGFTIEPREGTDGFDVVNADGKALNDKVLSKEEADELFNSLQ